LPGFCPLSTTHKWPEKSQYPCGFRAFLPTYPLCFYTKYDKKIKYIEGSGQTKWASGLLIKMVQIERLIMKLFFDTEFTGLTQDTTLVSIGLVSEDNRTFYAEFTDYSKMQVSEWIKDNVISNLHWFTKQSERLYIPNYHLGTKETIKESLANWFSQFDTVELVSDVSHYDMILLINIFGTPFDLPKNVAPCCHDINQDIADHYKICERDAFDMPRDKILYDKYLEHKITGNQHNAMYDAKVVREIYQIVKGIDFSKIYHLN